MHRPLAKLKAEPSGIRHGHQPAQRPAAGESGNGEPRRRRSLNEAAHKLQR